MSDPPLNTLRLQHCVERWQGGDRAAAEELLQVLGNRLEHLARLMLRRFPNVRAWAETLDVVQGSVIRFLGTLRNLRPESTQHFFNLAALNLRRELLDLARQFSTARFARVDLVGGAAEDSQGDGLDQKAAAPAPEAGDDLELWPRFHEAVEQLPAEEREVVSLVFYHGWSQTQIAELFGVAERTVRRRWQSACLQLNHLVGDRLPQL
jgi:RNA polymerase sigma-70 factor (ECF subfamily)